MADELLEEAVRRNQNGSNPWLRLHHGEILEQRGDIVQSLNQVRRANRACFHTPSCAFALAWAITRNSREQAVQFTNISAAVNRAKSRAERDAHLYHRSRLGDALLGGYREWGAAMDRAVGLDPKCPRGRKEAAFVLAQQRRVVPSALRRAFQGVVDGLPHVTEVAASGAEMAEHGEL